MDSTVRQALPAWLFGLPWHVLAALVALGLFGGLVLYSAGGGSLTPWAAPHLVRFALLGIVMLVLAQTALELWLRHAYAIYAVLLVALLGVEALGAIKGGSQRWLDLGLIRLQPSEFIKLAVVLALARYFHLLPRSALTSPRALLPAAGLVLVPAILVVLQPDLGTALAIIAGGAVVLFLAGLPAWWFGAALAAALAALPVAYASLHDYQKKRVLIFLNPEQDPLGSGYHITQSKIAIGSGGLFGKGFLNGTQTQLDYLPEMHTDFAFAAMAEEWGLVGGLFVLVMWAIILVWGLGVSLTARSEFARIAAAGLTFTLFFYIAVNLLMVMGLAPVVGIPLPLLSYGGSAMMTVMVTMGLLICLARHRDREQLGRLAGD